MLQRNVFSGRKHQSTHIFFYYFIAFFILGIIFQIRSLFPDAHFNYVLLVASCFGDYAFTMLEFLIFFVFFKKVLSDVLYQKIVAVICLLFMLLGGVLLIYETYANGMPGLKSTFFLFNVQAICLLIPCIFYYVEVFKSTHTLNLVQEPPFWIVTGLSFFLISTLTPSLFINYLPDLAIIFTLFYIFYSLLFLMIIKGHLCKQKAS